MTPHIFFLLFVVCQSVCTDVHHEMTKGKKKTAWGSSEFNSTKVCVFVRFKHISRSWIIMHELTVWLFFFLSFTSICTKENETKTKSKNMKQTWPWRQNSNNVRLFSFCVQQSETEKDVEHIKPIKISHESDSKWFVHRRECIKAWCFYSLVYMPIFAFAR